MFSWQKMTEGKYYESVQVSKITLRYSTGPHALNIVERKKKQFRLKKMGIVKVSIISACITLYFYYLTLSGHIIIYNYLIYLIKRPGVYFRSKSLEGAFNPGGRLLLCLLQNFCTAAVIVLFLGCCLSLNLFLSLNLSHRSALCVGISLSTIDSS